MSRLDDELRLAFRREEPSPDFTARVMRQIAASPAPKVKWWQAAAALFQPPRIRWAAIGAMALLLMAIGLFQYFRTQPVEPEQQRQADAREAPQPEEARPNLSPEPGPNHKVPAPRPALAPRRLVAVHHQRPAPKSEQQIAFEAEGNRAKDRVLMALQITSATLNEARRIVLEQEGDAAEPPRIR